MSGTDKLKQQFARWIKDYHAPLYRHAFWMTGSADSAADAVQEAFYQAWQSIDKLYEPDKALPWLMTILRRAVYREQRQQYSQLDVVEQLKLKGSDTGPDDTYSLVAIYSVLDKLSMQHREVFLLFHLHGFSYEEIAELLEIPVGTVMSRLARARDALHKLDQPQHPKIIDFNAKKRGHGHGS